MDCMNRTLAQKPSLTRWTDGEAFRTTPLICYRGWSLEIPNSKCADQEPTIKCTLVLLGNTFLDINPISIPEALATALNHPDLST